MTKKKYPELPPDLVRTMAAKLPSYPYQAGDRIRHYRESRMGYFIRGIGKSAKPRMVRVMWDDDSIREVDRRVLRPEGR